jgi:phage N-6-adenine-methyltransferase
MNSALMFSKASDEWSTPQDFWRELDAEFRFGLDAACSAENAKAPVGFGPDHPNPAARDALVPCWSEAARAAGVPPVAFLNPPYSRCAEFVAKAATEAQKGCTVVLLIPSRTDTRYWHAHIWDRETHQPKPGVEIRFVKGRLKFGAGKNSAPFPSVVIVMRPPA